ncbi:hypothetical protein ILUMI_23437 [Ignelater luminosus]|uniref:Spaetzle domain-containing protein n=1 Tax=Ignelater luminosus TaxID=2038154 RepID=A0A8K0G1V6_IGNLU|nr:hypothetical protein ILUMI_23437 [Ignelater luminosus]
MVLYKFWMYLALFGYTQLESVISAPCHESSSTNSSDDCESKSNKRKGVDDLSRILNHLNVSTHVLLESLLTGLIDENTNASPETNQQIIFPDSYELLNKPIGRIEKTPPCANGLSFCEDIDSYPYDHLRTVLQKKPAEKTFFGVDEAPETIANRFGGEFDDQPFICGSRETTIFPKVAMNKNYKWKYIINQGESDKYIQGIRIETCIKPESPCYLIGSAPAGYSTSCKQKFILRRLLSVSETGQPVADSFRIPSACCCSFKKDLDYLVNYGRNVSPSIKPPR